MRGPFVKSLVGSLHRSSFAHTSIEASGTLPTEANPRRALHPTARELHATHATRRERSARELATSPRGRRNGSHAASIRVGATRTEAPETYAVSLEASALLKPVHLREPAEGDGRSHQLAESTLRTGSGVLVRVTLASTSTPPPRGWCRSPDTARARLRVSGRARRCRCAAGVSRYETAADTTG